MLPFVPAETLNLPRLAPFGRRKALNGPHTHREQRPSFLGIGRTEEEAPATARPARGECAPCDSADGACQQGDYFRESLLSSMPDLGNTGCGSEIFPMPPTAQSSSASSVPEPRRRRATDGPVKRGSRLIQPAPNDAPRLASKLCQGRRIDSGLPSHSDSATQWKPGGAPTQPVQPDALSKWPRPNERRHVARHTANEPQVRRDPQEALAIAAMGKQLSLRHAGVLGTTALQDLCQRFGEDLSEDLALVLVDHIRRLHPPAMQPRINPRPSRRGVKEATMAESTATREQVATGPNAFSAAQLAEWWFSGEKEGDGAAMLASCVATALGAVLRHGDRCTAGSPNRSPNRSPQRSPNRSPNRSPQRSPIRATRNAERSGLGHLGSALCVIPEAPTAYSEAPPSAAAEVLLGRRGEPRRELENHLGPVYLFTKAVAQGYDPSQIMCYMRGQSPERVELCCRPNCVTSKVDGEGCYLGPGATVSTREQPIKAPRELILLGRVGRRESAYSLRALQMDDKELLEHENFMIKTTHGMPAFAFDLDVACASFTFFYEDGTQVDGSHTPPVKLRPIVGEELEVNRCPNLYAKWGFTMLHDDPAWGLSDEDCRLLGDSCPQNSCATEAWHEGPKMSFVDEEHADEVTGRTTRTKWWHERSIACQVMLTSEVCVEEDVQMKQAPPRFVTFLTKPSYINGLMDPSTASPSEKFATQGLSVFWKEVEVASTEMPVKGYVRDPRLFCPNSGGISLKLRITHEQYRAPYVSGFNLAAMKSLI